MITYNPLSVLKFKPTNIVRVKVTKKYRWVYIGQTFYKEYTYFLKIRADSYWAEVKIRNIL